MPDLEKNVKNPDGCFDLATEFVEKIRKEYDLEELSERERNVLYYMFIFRARRFGRKIHEDARKMVLNALNYADKNL